MANRERLITYQRKWREQHPGYHRQLYRNRVAAERERALSDERRLKAISARVDAYFARMYGSDKQTKARYA